MSNLRYSQHPRRQQKEIPEVCRKQHYTCCQQARPSNSKKALQEDLKVPGMTFFGTQKVGRNHQNGKHTVRKLFLEAKVRRQMDVYSELMRT